MEIGNEAKRRGWRAREHEVPQGAGPPSPGARFPQSPDKGGPPSFLRVFCAGLWLGLAVHLDTSDEGNSAAAPRAALPGGPRGRTPACAQGFFRRRAGGRPRAGVQAMEPTRERGPELRGECAGAWGAQQPGLYSSPQLTQS